MLYYTVTDQHMIAQADEFAAIKHAGQSRKDGTPYVHHPRYVSALAGYWAQQLFDEQPITGDCFSRLGRIRVAGLCHDLIEDQDVDWGTLAVMFGPTVADYVRDLSNDKTIKDNNERNLVYCHQLLSTSEDVQVIKLADIYHNAVSASNNPRFGTKWVKKARLMLNALKRVDGTMWYCHTEKALDAREALSNGTSVPSVGMGSYTDDPCQESGAARQVENESNSACC